MSIYTLRPNGDIASASITLLGAATATLAMNDNNDSTHVQHVSGVSYTLSNLDDLPALAATETVVRVRVRVRYGTLNGTTDFYALVENSSGQQSASDYYTPNLSGVTLTTYTGAWRNTAPDGGAWTAAKVNALRLRLQDNNGGGSKPQVKEAYVDVETNLTPVTTVTLPTGSVTDTTQPAVTATVADTEGDPIDAYEVKVFDAATYGAGGFNPDTATPTWTSGVVGASSPPTALVIGTPLANAVYRAYVRVRQGGSVIQQWGAWAFSSFTVAVTLPATPTLTVGAEAVGRNALNLQDLQNMLSADDASFEGSLGGWANLVNATVTRVAYAGTGADGAFAMNMLATAAATMQAVSGKVPCAAGVNYAAQARFYSQGAARSVRTDLKFYDASNNLLSTVGGTQVAVVASGNGISYVTGAAPVGATQVQAVATVLTPALSENWRVDNVAVIPGSTTPFTWSRGGLTALARFEVQRSLDSGVTWSKLNRVYVPSIGASDLSTLDYSDALQTLIGYDYEAPRGTIAQYRVRVTATLGTGLLITSAWSSVQGITTLGSGWVLKSLTDPLNYSVKPNIHSTDWTVKSTERQGVFHALGRKGAIVMSDIVGGEEGTLTLAFLDQAAFTAFEAMRARREAMLLQTPYGDNMYVRFGADRNASFMLTGGGVPKRIVTIPFYEVDVT